VGASERVQSVCSSVKLCQVHTPTHGHANSPGSYAQLPFDITVSLFASGRSRVLGMHPTIRLLIGCTPYCCGGFWRADYANLSTHHHVRIMDNGQSHSEKRAKLV
jgi:hypothetical protein